MSKLEKQKTKNDTGAALEAAKTAQAEAAKVLALAEQTFETDQSQPAWARVISGRTDLEYRDRILAFAQNAHDAAVRAEAERVAAEAEERRLQALAKIAADVASNVKEARAAAETIARCMAKSWDHRISAQGLGGSGADDLTFGLREAFFDGLLAVGLSPSAVTVH